MGKHRNENTVKAEIEQHPHLLAMARGMNYQNLSSTLLDLQAELLHSLKVTEELISKYGPAVQLNDSETPPANG